MSLTVIKSGFQDMVQDLGRTGYSHLGISETGAADSVSLRIANILLGNSIEEAAIEVTLFGGSYLFDKKAIILLSGSIFPSFIDNNPIDFFKPIHIDKGQTLTIGSTNGGARCYLAIKGGFDVPSLLGSKATHLMSKAGGFYGRNIKKGDKIKYFRLDDISLPNIKFNIDRDRSVLHVTKGLQFDLFDVINKELFFNNKFTVSHNSNRMGLRITGPKISTKISKDILTEGLPLGAIQITGSSDSIISFVDHQTTGGYPKIANVIAADLHKVGQLKPGDKFIFKLMSLDQAEKIYFQQESSLKI